MKQDIFATDDISTAGALTYWRLGGELDVEKLRSVWLAEGLDEKLLPDTPAASTALHRAVKELRDKRTLVRPLARRGAHAVVAESATGDTLDYGIDLKVKLGGDERPEFEPADHPWCAKVLIAFSRHSAECSSNDVGNWLCKLVRHVDGVSLRDSGGFYFIPPSRLEEWTQMTEALAAVSSNIVFRIPAMRSKDALNAVLDAVEREAAADAQAMEEELQAARESSKDWAERSIATRYARLEATEGKVERYENLLGQRLDSIRDRLNELRAGLAAASMSSQAAADAFEQPAMAAQ